MSDPPKSQQQQRQAHRPNRPRTPPRGEGGRGRGPVQLHEGSGIPHGHVPAYLPGSSSLVEELDSRVLIVLRDGKHIVGTLISYDQYSNLVVKDAVERRIVTASGSEQPGMPPTSLYSDIPHGIYTVRGDMVVLLGRAGPDELWHGAMKPATSAELDELLSSAHEDQQFNWDFDSDLIA